MSLPVKVTLLTRCGCSRSVETNWPLPQRIAVPLPSPIVTSFTESNMPPQPESREFALDPRSVQISTLQNQLVQFHGAVYQEL